MMPHISTSGPALKGLLAALVFMNLFREALIESTLDSSERARCIYSGLP